MIVIQDNSSVKGKLLSFNSRPRGQEHKNPEDKLHNYQNDRMTLHFQKEKKERKSKNYGRNTVEQLFSTCGL